jgi:hypothetical protein
MNDVINEVMIESQTNGKIIAGEVLLENIETIAEKLVFNKVPFWKKWLMNREDKELATTVVIYAIVYAIKTGGFGLTKYRISHNVIDYITLAANKKMITFLMKKLGVDFNIAKELLKSPTITKEN